MQITLNIPPAADLKMSEFDLKMTIGVALYEKGVMSSGFAAEILGIPRADFIRNMGKYGRSILEKTDDEIKEDALVAKQLLR
jgi:predicted HTH domain antitoxin